MASIFHNKTILYLWTACHLCVFLSEYYLQEYFLQTAEAYNLVDNACGRPKKSTDASSGGPRTIVQLLDHGLPASRDDDEAQGGPREIIQFLFDKIETRSIRRNHDQSGPLPIPGNHQSYNNPAFTGSPIWLSSGPSNNDIMSRNERLISHRKNSKSGLLPFFVPGDHRYLPNWNDLFGYRDYNSQNDDNTSIISSSAQEDLRSGSERNRNSNGLLPFFVPGDHRYLPRNWNDLFGCGGWGRRLALKDRGNLRGA